MSPPRSRRPPTTTYPVLHPLDPIQVGLLGADEATPFPGDITAPIRASRVPLSFRVLFYVLRNYLEFETEEGFGLVLGSWTAFVRFNPPLTIQDEIPVGQNCAVVMAGNDLGYAVGTIRQMVF